MESPLRTIIYFSPKATQKHLISKDFITVMLV